MGYNKQVVSVESLEWNFTDELGGIHSNGNCKKLKLKSNDHKTNWKQNSVWKLLKVEKVSR